MSIQDEARAEAEKRWADMESNRRGDTRYGFTVGYIAGASRPVEAAPATPVSDTDEVFAILDELNASNQIGYDDYSRLHDAVSRTSQPVQVTRDELADAMIASDALSDDTRAEARVAGSTQREPFLMFADAVMPFVVQPVQVEVTPEAVQRAATAMEGMHFIEHSPGVGEHTELTEPARLYFARLALGGGDHAAE